MARFLLPPDLWTQDPVLTGDEARHLSQVLRIRQGGMVTVFDGAGRRAKAEVLGVRRDEVPLRLMEETHQSPDKPSIHLAQAIPKGKNMDLIVQKAVELGVAGIQPLITGHTIVKPGEGKADKWRRTALEACKQCGQDWLPVIPDAKSFSAWLPLAKGELKLIASLAEGARPFRDVLESSPDPASITMLIGPEGDFSADETKDALDAGFIPVSLGEIVLRVETASLFCLSVLKYHFGC